MEIFLGLSKPDLMRALVAGLDHARTMDREFPDRGFNLSVDRYTKALEALDKL